MSTTNRHHWLARLGLLGYHQWGEWGKPVHQPGGCLNSNCYIETWDYVHRRICVICGAVDVQPMDICATNDYAAMERKYGPRGSGMERRE